MSRFALTAALVLASGCSFVLDFPEEVRGGGGGAGGDEGGGPLGGGGSGPTCQSEIAEVPWRGHTPSATEFDYVTVTGLSRDPDPTERWLDLFGESSSNIDPFTFPSSASNVLFAIRLPDDNSAEVLGTIVPCDAAVPDYSFANRVSHNTDDQLFISGGLPADDQTNYAFSPGETDNCSLGVTENFASDEPVDGALVPFFALMDPDGSSVDASVQDAGLTLATDVNAEVTAGLGVAFGEAFGAATGAVELAYFISRSPEMKGGNEVVFLDNVPEISYPRDLVGDLAVDGAANVWATGQSCTGACATSSLFIVEWPAAMPETQSIKIGGATASFGAAAAANDNAAFIGGGYQGALTIDDVPLEPTDDVGAFVAAFDVNDGGVLWTYPAEGTTPGFETTGFEAVVDIAVGDGSECGSVVYVVGCIADDKAGLQGCTAHRPDAMGRHAFVLKLDALTGQELWSTEIRPADVATSLFLPTAITADDSGFWVAASLRGQVDLAEPIESGPSTEAVVVRFTP
ncbi:MAG: hypothetical protein HOW73_00285 [Polyangiaceae bacterium]|nr:hypothetical protein [Polyangiaceae bacterium]